MTDNEEEPTSDLPTGMHDMIDAESERATGRSVLRGEAMKLLYNEAKQVQAVQQLIGEQHAARVFQEIERANRLMQQVQIVMSRQVALDAVKASNLEAVVRGIGIAYTQSVARAAIEQLQLGSTAGFRNTLTEAQVQALRRFSEKQQRQALEAVRALIANLEQTTISKSFTVNAVVVAETRPATVNSDEIVEALRGIETAIHDEAAETRRSDADFYRLMLLAGVLLAILQNPDMWARYGVAVLDALARLLGGR
jgi:hypothetical protein